jgi:hypothetical protein
MKKLVLVIAAFALLSACKETIYTYEQFYENPQMTQEYVAKWENNKNANQDQLNLAKKAVDEHRLEEIIEQYKAEGARLIQSRLDDLDNANVAANADPIEDYYFMLNPELAREYQRELSWYGHMTEEMRNCQAGILSKNTPKEVAEMIRAKEGL